MEQPLITIGCDPGENSALAMWVDETLRIVKRIKSVSHEADKRKTALDELERLDVFEVADLEFVCEDQFLGRGAEDEDPGVASGRMSRILKTARSAARWEEQARIRGWRTAPSRIPPQTWRSTFGLGARRFKGRRSKVAKEALTTISPGTRWTLDTAEAALIALHRHIARASDGQRPKVHAALLIKARRIRDAVGSVASTSRTAQPRRNRSRKGKGRPEQVSAQASLALGRRDDRSASG